MNLNQLHFAHPLWLLAAFAIPIVWICYFLFFKMQSAQKLDKFIDKHLLTFLLVNPLNQKKKFRNYLFFWTFVWLMLTLALGGPRWSFREIETFSKDQNLILLLDLSESMNATDIKPSRLIRAKQKIEDLLHLAQGVKIGLIAFAADPHMIAPLTDDKKTIQHLLSSLDTNLVYIQGSKLSPAFDMALKMLESEPGNNNALLVVSDGGFDDASALVTAKKLADKGIVIHTMGVGTKEGAPITDKEGNTLKKNGVPVLSKLEQERFSEISKLGNGHYFDAKKEDEIMILQDLAKRAEAKEAFAKKNKIWEEHFYLFILATLPFIFLWFRKGYLFVLFLFLSFPLSAELSDYFKNSEQLGKQSFEQGDYETAIEAFQDPYRKGVSYYKAGDYVSAEKMFRNSTREEVASSSAYNLGNALAMQQKFKEAIVAYEDVLKKWPDHIEAKENLELIKKILNEQKQEPPPPKQDNPQQNSPPEKKEDEEKNNDGQKDKESQNERDAEEKEQDASPQTPKSQEEKDADLMLNCIENDPKTFMKNQFYIESKKNGTKQEIDPW